MEWEQSQQESRIPRIWLGAILISLAAHGVLFNLRFTNPEKPADKRVTLNVELKPHYPLAIEKKPEILDEKHITTNEPELTPATQPEAPPPSLPQKSAPQTTPQVEQSSKLTSPEKPLQHKGTVFDARLRKKLQDAQNMTDFSQHRQPKLTTFTAITGELVLKRGRYCSTFNEGVDETDPGMWTLPYKCDSRPNESQRIKNAISNALRNYRGER